MASRAINMRREKISDGLLYTAVLYKGNTCKGSLYIGATTLPKSASLLIAKLLSSASSLKTYMG